MREFPQDNLKRPTSKRFQREERIIDAAINILYRRFLRPVVEFDNRSVSYERFVDTYVSNIRQNHWQLVLTLGMDL